MQNAPKDLSDSSDKLANLEQQLREREEWLDELERKLAAEGEELRQERDRLLALAIGLQLRIQESPRPQQQQQQQQSQARQRGTRAGIMEQFRRERQDWMRGGGRGRSRGGRPSQQTIHYHYY